MNEANKKMEAEVKAAARLAEEKFRSWRERNPQQISPEGVIIEKVNEVLSRLEPTMYDMVMEFHEYFEIMPDDMDLREQKLAHVKEEIEELLAAESPEQLLDAICDLIYVLMGFSIHMKFHLIEAFRRVHAANMLKAKDPGEGKQVSKPTEWEPPNMRDLV